jgi:hypothetical protein
MTVFGTGQRTLTDMNDVIAQTTAPSNPMEGTLWFNTTDNKLYVYSNNAWKFVSDGLAIGGTNMFRYSGNFGDTLPSSTYWSNNGGGLTLDAVEKWNGYNTIRTTVGAGITGQWYKLENGVEYTYSVMLKASSAITGTNSVPIHYWAGLSNTSQSKISIVKFDTTYSSSDIGKYKRLYITFKLTGDADSFKPFVYIGSGTTTFNIAYLKLERGSIPTDYSPNPEDIETIIEDIQATLGNMANDNLIDYSERQVVKDSLTEIIGYVIADDATTLPTASTLDSGAKGNFYTYRKRALNAGITASDTGIAYGATTYGATYTAVQTKYEALKTYLEGLIPIDIWDLRTATQSTNITVVKSDFRTKWMEYYQACEVLAEATAKKLKDNVDNVSIGGTNYASNGNFAFDIATSLWKTAYVGQTKEVIDISTETPPHKYAYHVKNTTNASGGIFSPSLWSGDVAGQMLGKDISISFWLKYQNIVQGVSTWQLGRFGELVVEGETSGGAKVYDYPRIQSSNGMGTGYFSGTNMTWTKYYGTYKVVLPATAVKITNIMFKHGIEACTGEFWTTGIMVELGNKISDWSVSPLDLQQKFTDIEFGIQGDQIVSRITSQESNIIALNQGVTWGGTNYVLNSNFIRGLKNWFPINYNVNDMHQIDEDEQFEENEDIGIFFDYIFGEDGADFNQNAQSQTVDSKRWLKISGNQSSVYGGVYQNVKLEKDKQYIISLKAFREAGTLSSLEVFLGDNLIDTIALTDNGDLYYYRFTSTTSSELPLKFIGSSTDEYIVYITEIQIEEGNIKPTSWSPAPDDSIDDINAIDLLSTKMSSVEQRITADSLTTTITSAKSFSSLMDGKADASSLGSLATKGELTTLENGIGGIVDGKINDLNLNGTFVTQTVFEQSSSDITAKFSATGGMNLLKNSIGFAEFITLTQANAGVQNWFVQGIASRASRIQNGELDTLGFSSGFNFNASATATDNTSIDQYVSVIPNKEYTLSWYLKKTNSTQNQGDNGSFKVAFYEGNVLKSEYKYDSGAVTNGYESKFLNYTPTTNKVQIRLYAHGLSQASITGLMFTIGDVALQWSLATGESFNTNVRLDINGIRVSQLNTNRAEIGYTQITPDEFAGYYDSDGDGNFEKIFYLNGDETVTKKIRALNEITMGNLKIININQSGNNGWAFVPIT